MQMILCIYMSPEKLDEWNDYAKIKNISLAGLIEISVANFMRNNPIEEHERPKYEELQRRKKDKN